VGDERWLVLGGVRTSLVYAAGADGRTLEYLDERWGGGEQYVQQHGLTAEESSDVRTRLAEPAD
jgi:hypothetical protein